MVIISFLFLLLLRKAEGKRTVDKIVMGLSIRCCLDGDGDDDDDVVEDLFECESDCFSYETRRRCSCCTLNSPRASERASDMQSYTVREIMYKNDLRVHLD